MQERTCPNCARPAYEPGPALKPVESYCPCGTATLEKPKAGRPRARPKTIRDFADEMAAIVAKTK